MKTLTTLLILYIIGYYLTGYIVSYFKSAEDFVTNIYSTSSLKQNKIMSAVLWPLTLLLFLLDLPFILGKLLRK